MRAAAPPPVAGSGAGGARGASARGASEARGEGESENGRRTRRARVAAAEEVRGPRVEVDGVVDAVVVGRRRRLGAVADRRVHEAAVDALVGERRRRPAPRPPPQPLGLVGIHAAPQRTQGVRPRRRVVPLPAHALARRERLLGHGVRTGRAQSALWQGRQGFPLQESPFAGAVWVRTNVAAPRERPEKKASPWPCRRT